MRMLYLRRAHRGCARDRGAEQDVDAHDARTGAQSGRGAPAPSAAAVREQLERIVASPAFETSERNRRFLRFVVNEALAGRADRLKGYCIATTVFDRDEMFDPQLDPIVRIEAGRLRRSLQHYYLTAGKDDPVRIAVPKGSYVPTFEHGTEARSPALALPSIDPRAESRSEIGPRLAAWRWRSLAGAVAALVGLGVSALLVTIGLHGHWSTTSPSTVPRGPAVLVLPFELSGTTAGIHLDLRRELTREVVADLTRFTEISVYAADSSATPDDTRRRMRELGIDYGVTGGVALVPNRLHVTASLVDARTGRQLWSIIVDTDLTDGDVSRLQADIASRIARELAEPYGAIFNEKAKEIAIKPPHALSSYECVLRYDLFWRRLDLQQLALARECLERAAKAAPADANTQAALALAVLDTVRFGGAKTPPAERATLLERSQQLANHAIELAPDAARGYRALQHVYWMRGEFERSFAAGERARTLNPYDSNVLVELGARYVMRGLWDKGVPMLEEAYARNPALPSVWRSMLALYCYVHGRYREAIAEAKTAEATAFPWGPAVLAMAHVQLGEKREAEAAVNRILHLSPRFREEAAANLEMWHLHPDLIRAIIEGLRDAGLDVRT